MSLPGPVAPFPWRRRCVWVLVVAVSLSTSVAIAQTSQPDLTTASLEDLMNVEVTSASRREQRAADIPAAVYVITRDDIRRSGLTSVPELLRLAPGVEVARIDSSKWAVTIRGSNHRFSDKLLVLVDGRTVYTRQFSGVHWDTLNVMIEDIDRIEVVRGPGGAVWGANAVNGVINIITKSATETQGPAIRASLGNNDGRSVAARYGGTKDAMSYRVYVDSAQHPHTMLDESTAGEDDWTALKVGTRLDWHRGEDRVTAQADVARSDSNFRFNFPDGVVAPPLGWPLQLNPSDATRGSALARWTREAGNGRTFEAQGFFEITERDEGFQHYDSKTYDADLKYHARQGRHDLVSGVGFRETREHSDPTFALVFTPEPPPLRVFNLFVQDEVRTFGDRLRLTGGVKFEHETLSSWSVQPTGRALWSISDRQRVWGAASRAIRTPSVVNRFARVNFTSFPSESGLPIVVSILGNPDYQSEETFSVEGGYRFERRPLSLDVSLFANHHDRLPTLEPLPPQVELTYGRPSILVASRFANLMEADTRGVEIAGRWSSAAWWRIDATYTYFRFTPHPDPASTAETNARDDGNTPNHQWSLRPAVTLGTRVDLNATVLRVGRIASLEVPAYTRADVRAEWKVTGRWSLVFAGQNLFGDPHAEFAGAELATTPMLIPRQINGRLVWRF